MTNKKRIDEWETYCDEWYYHLWRLRRKNERGFNDGFHINNGDEAKGLCDLLNNLEAKLTAASEYADKLAAGLPDGMLPKDVEVLREANLGLAVELTAVTEQRDSLVQVIEAATILIAAKGRHNTMLAYNGLRVALQSLNQDHFPDVGNMIGTTTTEP